MEVYRLSTPGISRLSLISPDGTYTVHAVSVNGQESLWTRQVATNSDVQILAPADVIYHGLTLSPDGNYVYYVVAENRMPLVRALYQVPIVGGVPRKIIF